MVKQPAIDIIIPNYNKAKYLNQCLDSIISQTYKNWKVYLIDDNSKDNSVEIRCMEISSATDYGDQMNFKSFKPNLFVNIKKFWKKKQDSLAVYKEELRKYPHSRSIKAIKNLSMYRGSQVGMEMVECFEVIRKVL